MLQVLVVDDEDSVRSSLERVLGHEGYWVATAGSGREALEAIERSSPDAVVLDLMLPQGPDGLDVCRRLRAGGDRTPVLILTARDGVADRVHGLDAGADDYVVKPFALDELLARLRALLRRTGPEGCGEVLRFADLCLDTNLHRMRRGGRTVDLTQTEFMLLDLFLRHPRQVLTRAQILECVWGYDFGPRSNSLEVYIGYLRRKTEAGDRPRLLHTVRSVGYVLRD